MTPEILAETARTNRTARAYQLARRDTRCRGGGDLLPDGGRLAHQHALHDAHRRCRGLRAALRRRRARPGQWLHLPRRRGGAGRFPRCPRGVHGRRVRGLEFEVRRPILEPQSPDRAISCTLKCAVCLRHRAGVAAAGKARSRPGERRGSPPGTVHVRYHEDIPAWRAGPEIPALLSYRYRRRIVYGGGHPRATSGPAAAGGPRHCRQAGVSVHDRAGTRADTRGATAAAPAARRLASPRSGRATRRTAGP